MDSDPGWERSPGIASNLHQCSCLENAKDKGAWQPTVHGLQRIRHGWVSVCTWDVRENCCSDKQQYLSSQTNQLPAWFCLFLSVWRWAHYVSSQNLDFLPLMRAVCILQDVEEIKLDNLCRLVQCLAHCGHLATSIATVISVIVVSLGNDAKQHFSTFLAPVSWKTIFSNFPPNRLGFGGWFQGDSSTLHLLCTLFLLLSHQPHLQIIRH